LADQKPHSADVLNDTRDYWWSPDFIALMAKRWELEEVHSVLDVGCGIGHWGHMLAPHFAQDAKLYGIDPEATWVAQAAERAACKGLQNRSHYQLGSAENIPFPKHHFDMVTCQTVLVHVKDAAEAIKEMLRVLKPGGLLAVAEPNNLVSQLVFNNLNSHQPIEDILDQVCFNLICERGREALGRGNASRGDLIPAYFHQAGLSDIKVFMSDLADYFIPPYTTPREEAAIASLAHQPAEAWREAEAEMNAFYLAGGGTQEEFETSWEGLRINVDKIIHGYKDKTLCSAGGLILYLISGRKSA
jgi:ubiquinone/menaquinone biosynthesis C-methylase UbiE